MVSADDGERLMGAGRTVAVIDVGSNSVRLLVARELSSLAFEVIDEERFAARLGEGQDDAGLTAEGMARGLEALRLVTQVAASHRPAVIEAVGTEALRRAPNAQDFLAEVERETGVAVRILPAHEEARASYIGVVNSTLLEDGAIVDIGGGSLEVMQVRGRRLVMSTSAPLGAIYATEHYLTGNPPTNKEIRALRRAVAAAYAETRQTRVLVGVGGAVRNLARIVRTARRYPLRRLHGLAITRREMSRLAGTLARSTADERRRMTGVSSARGDFIHAAAIVLDAVMDVVGAETLTVSGQGLREGLAWRLLREGPVLLPDVRAASISGLARANGVDHLAAEPVAVFARRLFEATAPTHGLGPAELDLLESAAGLAGIGMHVDYYDRDRHAEYLVHSGDLHGFSHREIVLLGAIVRCSESGTPDLTPYRPLLEAADPRRAAVLATLLGLARGVYRRGTPPLIGPPVVASDGSTVEVRFGAPCGSDAEAVALARQQKRLEAVLGLGLRVSIVDAADNP